MLTSTFVYAADAPPPSQPAEPPADAWRDVDPNNLVLIETKYGEVAVELAPVFAPHHVDRVRKLVRAHFYDGLAFYRVVDGYVAQGGIGDIPPEQEKQLEKKWPPLKHEFDVPQGDAVFTPLGNEDLFAPEVGHVDGFPVGRDPKDGRMWPISCPGIFAFARDNDPDTAATEFYIVIGERPPRLERNLSAFGRVIEGMQYLQKLERGDPDVNMGVIGDASKQDKIISMKLAADVPKADRPRFQVMKTESEWFAKFKDSKRNLTSPFFYRKPLPILNVCAVEDPVRRAP